MTTPAPRRGLLIDYGGVLTTDVFASFDVFCGREGLRTGRVAELFRTDPAAQDLLVGLELGAITERDFEQGFAALLGVAPHGLIRRMLGNTTSDLAMIGAVRSAREAGVRTCLVSNSWSVAHYDRPLLQRLFDAVVISAEVGVRKPTTAIYRLGADAVDLPPEECVFVDDLPGNLKPARAMGMATVRHRSAAESIAALEQLLGVTLAEPPPVGAARRGSAHPGRPHRHEPGVRHR